MEYTLENLSEAVQDAETHAVDASSSKVAIRKIEKELNKRFDAFSAQRKATTKEVEALLNECIAQRQKCEKILDVIGNKVDKILLGKTG